MSNIAFFESITSYYVDMHNYLHDKLNFNIYYLYKDFLNHNTEDLSKSLHYKTKFLSPKGKNSFRFKELVAIIKENSPQHIISIEYSILTLQLIIIRLLYRFKYKIIVRTDDSIDMLNHSLTFKHSLAKKIMSPFIDNFILCDEAVYRHFQENMSKGAYFPIVKDEQKMLKGLKEAAPFGEKLKREYGLENMKIIIFVGRLVPVKNIDVIFKAINMIERDDFAMVIVGDGVLREELEKTAKESKHKIIFTGNLTGTPLLAWYNIAHSIILPSWKEAFGAVVNEAMIANCVPIVSEKIGAKCLIQDGVNGYVFNPESHETLAEIITKVIETYPTQKEYKNLMSMTFNDYANNIYKIVYES